MAAYYLPKMYEILQGRPACMDFFESRAPETMKKRLFMYRHRLSGAFILAAWITNHGVFDPIIQVPGKDVPALDAATVEKFLQAVHPQGSSDIEKVVLDGIKEQGRQDEEMTQERVGNRAKILRDEFNVRTPVENATVLLPNSGGLG